MPLLAEAGAAIVVCGDMNKAACEAAQSLWVNDCSMASQNILLAVEALGLGATYTAVYPNRERIMAVGRLFELPDTIFSLCVIPIGCPAQNEAPKDKWNPDNIHWNSFN